MSAVRVYGAHSINPFMDGDTMKKLLNSLLIVASFATVSCAADKIREEFITEQGTRLAQAVADKMGVEFTPEMAQEGIAAWHDVQDLFAQLEQVLEQKSELVQEPRVEEQHSVRSKLKAALKKSKPFVYALRDELIECLKIGGKYTVRLVFLAGVIGLVYLGFSPLMDAALQCGYSIYSQAGAYAGKALFFAGREFARGTVSATKQIGLGVISGVTPEVPGVVDSLFNAPAELIFG